MATLHIEHPISDLETWREGFASFAEARRNAGVRRYRVYQPMDDAQYIYVQLDFDSEESAQAFKGFLESRVWASRESSPALAGAPKARVLSEVTVEEYT